MPKKKSEPTPLAFENFNKALKNFKEEIEHAPKIENHEKHIPKLEAVVLLP